MNRKIEQVFYKLRKPNKYSFILISNQRNTTVNHNKMLVSNHQIDKNEGCDSTKGSERTQSNKISPKLPLRL